MNKLVLPVALLLMTATGAPAFALDDAAAKVVMEKAVDLYIRPAYKDFHQKAAALAAETAKLCEAPSEAALKTVNARFADTIESWGRIEILRDGPVMQENRFERILFFPDRKSTGLKQVQALIANPDESATDPQALKGRSVAMQGLGAFEYVFFGSYPEGVVAEKNSFRCRYGLAIAKNVEAIGGELDAAWNKPGGIQDDWKHPSADNPVYRDNGEAIQALIGLHVNGLEMVRDKRIKLFYRGKGEKVSPKAAIFWRSGNTARALAANIDGLGTLWKVSDMGALLPEDVRSLADSAGFDYRTAVAALRKLDPPTAEALNDKKYLARLDFIEFTLKDAIKRVNNDVGGAVGLGAGFSFSDGD
jgi:predicted lipoprotein